jgi:hypothetical protein
MSVDRNEVSRIAALARLELDPEEVQRLTTDMNRILRHAAHLGEVATPTSSSVVEGDGGGERGSVEERSSIAGTHDGTTRDASDEGVEGARVGGTGVPDPLAAPAERWGPRVEEGFFVVPPLPGTRPGKSP